MMTLKKLAMAAVCLLAPMGAQADTLEPPKSYLRHCKVCHQQAGEGTSTTYPRIAGRAAAIASSDKGRAHLVQVLLYGQFGTIEVDGKTYRGLMAPFGRLKDDELADILTYITALKAPDGTGGDMDPYTADEIASVRASGKLSAGKVYKQRIALKEEGLLP